jgi:hypothetical protein
MFGLSRLAITGIVAAALVAGFLTWLAINNATQRNIGAGQVTDGLRANDADTTQQMDKDNADLNSKSDDDLVREFRPDGL